MDFDFSKNTKVDSLDAVPEDFRGLYREVEGEDGFSLGSDEPGVKSAVAAVSRLNNALKASRADVDRAKGKAVDLSTLSEFGATPDEILAAFTGRIDEANSKVKGNEEAKAEVGKVTEALTKKHAGDIEKHTKRSEALQGQLYKVLVEKAVLSEIGDQAKNPNLLMPFIRNQVRTEEVDGEFVVQVIDENGPRFSGTTGGPMTIGELIKEMKASEEYGILFKSDAPSGSGKNPGSSQHIPAGKPGTKTAMDKIRAGLAARGR